MAAREQQADDLLDRWDEVERRLDRSEPESEEWTQAADDVTALRREWRARRRDRADATPDGRM